MNSEERTSVFGEIGRNILLALGYVLGWLGELLMYHQYVIGELIGIAIIFSIISSCAA